MFVSFCIFYSFVALFPCPSYAWNNTTSHGPLVHGFCNLLAKRFEILDSLRGEANVEMINHANKLVEAIKRMYRVNYSDSRRQIEDWELMYIPGPKQNNGLVFSHYFGLFILFLFFYIPVFLITVSSNYCHSLPSFYFSALIAASLCSRTSNCGMVALWLLYPKIRCQVWR